VLNCQSTYRIISNDTGEGKCFAFIRQTHVPDKSTVFVRPIFKIQQSAIGGCIASRRADHELHCARPDASNVWQGKSDRLSQSHTIANVDILLCSINVQV